MNAHPGDDAGVPGTVYVLHLEPAYRHARHYIGWTAGDVDARLAEDLTGHGSPASPSTSPWPCGAAAMFLAHDHALHRVVQRRGSHDPDIVDDACQFGWLQDPEGG